jgi:Tol biopolymer transport system component
MPTRVVLSLLTFVALALPAAADAAVPEGSTFLLSRPSGLGALPSGGVNDSWLGRQPSNENGGATGVSGTARFVAFTSSADGLSAEDDDRLANVFVRDNQTGTTELVSRATGATGAAANGDSRDPSISADGTRVAFVSAATNLPAGATAYDAVYVRNLATDTTTLVSRADGAGGAVANSYSMSPSISSDGTRVGFQSSASNLDASDVNLHFDVFVRILATDDTVLVSRATGAGGAVADSDAYHPALDADGSRVAFETNSTNLDAADTNGQRDIYRRDLATSQTILISRATGAAGVVSNNGSYYPAINGDGSRIAFQSGASNIEPADADSNADVYRRDAVTFTTMLVSRADGAAGANADSSAYDPSIDSAGDTIAFNSWAGNIGGGPAGLGEGQVYIRELGTSNTKVVSRAGGASGAVADVGATGSAISGDGTSVAFESRASNLATDDDDDFRRVFLRDVDGAEPTTLVSRPSGTAAFVGGSNASLIDNEAGISADGRFVVFHSDADALLDTPADDRNGGIYVRDAVTGATELVSRADGPDGAPADDWTPQGSISAEGSRVAFLTSAKLVPEDVTSGEDGTDVYVRDRSTATTTLASRATGPAGAPANGFSQDPTISADGNRVAFVSGATNLDAADPNSMVSVFVRDLAAAATQLASRADGPAGATATDSARNPVLDADGSRVAFETYATNLGDGDVTPTGDVHLRDLATGSTVLVSRADGAAGAQGNGGSGRPAINADGTRVAFESHASNFGGDSPSVPDIFLRDVAAATTVLVSRADGAAGAPAGGSSYSVTIDASGTRVAFTSLGQTLFPGDDNNRSDVFLRDVAAATTTLVSRADGAGGALGDGESEGPSLSASGNCVAFASYASNLVASGYGATDFSHVYMRVVRGECAVVPPGPGPGGGGGGGADVVAPVLDRVALSAKRFRVGKAATATAAAKRAPAGTRFSWRLSEAARVTVRIERATAGKRKGKRCVAPTKKLRKARKCTRWVRAGTLARQSAAGTTKLAFSGRIGSKALKAGSYRAVVWAADAAGNASPKRTIAFKVVKRQGP